MASLMKASSFLLVNRRGDSKPSPLIPLKWRMNPLLRTTQICPLPSSSMMMMMIKKNSTTASGLIRTIKCSSSSSNGWSDYKCRVRWVEEEQEHLFKEGRAVLKALTTPVVAAALVDILLTNYPALVSSRTAILFGAMLAYDLCRAIASARRINDGRIRFSLGPVLGSIVLSLWALMALFGKGMIAIGTVTWEGEEEEGNENTSITHKIIGYMVKIVGYIVLFMDLLMLMLCGFGTLTLPLPWPRSKKKSTKPQAGVTEEMVNAVVNSAFGSKDTDLAGETAARRPEAARAAHEEQEDPIAKGDDEEERTRRDKIEHDMLK